MNILVLSWRGPGHPLAGGAEQVMHEHMKGWSQAGHSVTLFTSHFSHGKKEENIDGVQIIRRGNQILTVHVSAFWWYLFGSHGKFDLVIDQFHGIPFFSPLYMRIPKLAVVQEVAREVWLKNDLHFPWNKIVGFIGYHGEWFVYSLYKKIPFITGSESAKQELIKMGITDKNVAIVPHGVIVPKVKQYSKEKKKTVMFLGALAKDKGVEDALYTFSLLPSDYQFWIVGRGGDDYVRFLKRLAKNLKIADRTTFWGFVSQEKKFELLSRTHILVNPSLLEGWGLVNIEANAMGTPVIAYRSPGLVDSVKHNQSGILAQSNTPTELSKEINKLIENPDKLKKLQQGALSWSKQFSWEQSRKNSLDIISSVLRRNS